MFYFNQDKGKQWRWLWTARSTGGSWRRS